MDNRYIVKYDIKQRCITNARFVQGDNGTGILDMFLFDGGVPINITGETLEFYFQKSDGTYSTQDSSTGVSVINASIGNVQCVLNNITTSCVGSIKCQIQRTKDGNLLTAPEFDFVITERIANKLVISNYIASVENKLLGWQSQEDLRQSNEVSRQAGFKTAMDDYNAVKNDLNGSINTGNILHATLQSDITTGNTLKPILDASVKPANDAAIAVANAIRAGNYSINILDSMAEGAANIAREACPSGVLKFSTIDFTYSKTNPNKIRLTGGGVALVNGYKIMIPDGTIIDVGAPPTAGEREDLVFLEVWKQTDTDGIVSLQNRVRVVQGVDFSKTPEGFMCSAAGYSWSTAIVTAQGGNSAPLSPSDYTAIVDLSYPTVNKFNDRGLFIAGYGDQTSKNTLKTSDGYCYAIPLFRIRRRNSGDYSTINPNGSIDYYKLTLTYLSNIKNKQIGQVQLINQAEYDRILVGDKLITEYPSDLLIVKSKDGLNKITVENNHSGGNDYNFSGGTYTLWYIKSRRPDQLYNNIIDDVDITELRHQISLTGFDYQSLLDDAFSKLYRNDLQTKERKKMLKVYHGIPKTPVDANTVFYASLDGTTVAEVGGVTNITPTFGAAWTGMGQLSGSAGVVGDILNIGLGNTFTIDFQLDCMNEVVTDTGIMALLNANNYNAFSVSVAKSLRQLYIICSNVEGMYSAIVAVNISLSGINHYRVTYNNGIVKVYINGVLVKTQAVGNIFTITKIRPLGYYYKNNTVALTSKNTLIADLMVSNIDRGATFATLPSDFIQSYARIDKAFNGQRKTYSDALSSQYTIGIATASNGCSKGLSLSQSTPGEWSSGDAIKIKGLAGEIISGVIDTDTALTSVALTSGANVYTVVVDDVSKFNVNDVFKFFIRSTGNISNEYTVTAIDTVNKTLTCSSLLNVAQGDLLIETTASSSSPVVKYMPAMPTVASGTWTGLGTNEATFTLGTNPTLINLDLYIEYSLNMESGQAGIPELYTSTLAGEYKGKKLINNAIAHITDDYLGKLGGSTTENPNKASGLALSSCVNPAGQVENFVSEHYSKISKLDGTVMAASATSNGSIPQQLFSFNIIEIIERKFGTIKSLNKIQWLKDNVTSIRCDWYGYGTCPSGNKAYFAMWDVVNSNWTGAVSSHSASVPTLITRITTNLPYRVDTNGYINFLAYTDASNGTISSTINTDYINIELTLKTPTGYDVLSPENTRRDDGISNILLIRKETKEIQTMFDSLPTDGIVTYGNYVPLQAYVPGFSGGAIVSPIKNTLTSNTTKLCSDAVYNPQTKFDLLDDFKIIGPTISSSLTNGIDIEINANSKITSNIIDAYISGYNSSFKYNLTGKVINIASNLIGLDETGQYIAFAIDSFKNINPKSRCVALSSFIYKDLNGALYLIVIGSSKKDYIGYSANTNIIYYQLPNRPLIK